ncbi:hypothetical protein [Rhodanobacter aciditrophus]|uniref:hypothetical protein n=1 Tax=Rhodanobacter aciditrophus TaxID=1623218 RepID=UPI003CF5E738
MNTHRTSRRTPLYLGLAGLAAALALGGSHAAWSPIATAAAQDSHGGSHGSGSHGSQDKGSKGGKGKGSMGGAAGSSTHGSSGSQSVESKVLHGHQDAASAAAAEEESSDRRGPQYGGGRSSTGKPAGAGTKKGDVLGDLNVILRDANGVPILDQYGHVQPLDADGNPIPLTPEGDIVAGYEDLVVPVEFSRLSVSRSPDKVLDKSYNEAITALNSATAIATDASGRLVVTVDGTTSTIDSPLENLALYQALLNNGYLPGFVPKDGVSLGNLSSLVDKTTTKGDLLQAASFLAAASDKAGSISDDTVVYTDAILGITGATPIVGTDGKSYYDFSSATYDRSATYSGTVTYLKSNGDGTYTSVTAPILDAVFGGTNYTGTQLDAFTQAADDARAVIEFVHDNPVPSQ